MGRGILDARAQAHDLPCVQAPLPVDDVAAAGLRVAHLRKSGCDRHVCGNREEEIIGVGGADASRDRVQADVEGERVPRTTLRQIAADGFVVGYRRAEQRATE